MQTKKSGLTGQFARYVTPSVVSMIIFSFYTMADGLFVAHGVGEKALAAVNLSAPYNSIIFAVGLLMAVGTSTVIAVSLGRGDEAEACRIFSQNICAVALIAIVISILTLLNLERFALFLGADSKTLVYVKQYVGTIAPFAIFFMVSYNLEVLVKTDGTPALSVVGVTCAGLSNVFLDWLFVIKFHWGVWGAAFATGLAQVFSTLIFLSYFIFKSHKLKLRRFKPQLGIYRRIVPLGLADSITDMSNGIVLFLYNRTILTVIGVGGVVCYTVIGYINTLVIMIISGVSQGIQPLISFHHGKKEQSICRRFYTMGLLTAVIFGIAAFLISFFFAGGFVGMFLESGSPSFPMGVGALKFYAWSFLFAGYNIVTAAYFTATEHPRLSLPVSLGRGLLFPALSLAILPSVIGENGVWLSAVAAEVMCLLLTTGFLIMRQRRAKKL